MSNTERIPLLEITNDENYSINKMNINTYKVDKYYNNIKDNLYELINPLDCYVKVYTVEELAELTIDSLPRVINVFIPYNSKTTVDCLRFKNDSDEYHIVNIEDYHIYANDMHGKCLLFRTALFPGMNKLKRGSSSVSGQYDVPFDSSFLVRLNTEMPNIKYDNNVISGSILKNKLVPTNNNDISRYVTKIIPTARNIKFNKRSVNVMNKQKYDRLNSDDFSFLTSISARNVVRIYYNNFNTNMTIRFAEDVIKTILINNNYYNFLLIFTLSKMYMYSIYGYKIGEFDYSDIIDSGTRSYTNDLSSTINSIDVEYYYNNLASRTELHFYYRHNKMSSGMPPNYISSSDHLSICSLDLGSRVYIRNVNRYSNNTPNINNTSNSNVYTVRNSFHFNMLYKFNNSGNALTYRNLKQKGREYKYESYGILIDSNYRRLIFCNTPSTMIHNNTNFSTNGYIYFLEYSNMQNTKFYCYEGNANDGTPSLRKLYETTINLGNSSNDLVSGFYLCKNSTKRCFVIITHNRVYKYIYGQSPQIIFDVSSNDATNIKDNYMTNNNNILINVVNTESNINQIISINPFNDIEYKII